MNWKPSILTVVLVCTVLSGCTGPPDPTETPDPSQWSLDVVRMDSETGCAQNLCQANPSGTHATEVREEFGLEMLTDDEYNIRHQRIEQDWLVWQGNHAETHPRGDILAMHIPTREVYGVAMGPGHSIRPFLDEGRVVFQYASENYTGLAMWEVGADTVKPLLIEPKGNYRISDFQGDWIAVSVGHSENESHAGEWVWNIKEDRGNRVYVPPPNPDRGPPEEGLRGQGVDINEEYAYFIVGRDNEPGETPLHFYDVHEVNLSTGEKRVIPAEKMGAVGAIEAGPRVFVDTERGVHEFHPENASFTRLGIDDGRDCASLFGKYEWIWMDCNNPRSSEYIYYDMDAETLHVYQVKEGFNYRSTATDGDVVVFDGRRAAKGQLGLYSLELEDFRE